MQSPYREKPEEDIPSVLTDTATITIVFENPHRETVVTLAAKVYPGCKYEYTPYPGSSWGTNILVNKPYRENIQHVVEQYIAELYKQGYYKRSDTHYDNFLSHTQILIVYSKDKIKMESKPRELDKYCKVISLDFNMKE